MKTNKIELGDIFELENNDYTIYFQCVENPIDTRNEIELIKVFYGLYRDKILDLEIFKSLDDFFFIRFPLKAALKRKIIKKVGSTSLENFEVPKYYRTTNFTGDAWQIVDAKTLKRETVIELSEEQKRLSPWGMMNDTLIIELLEKGWKLETWTLDNMW